MKRAHFAALAATLCQLGCGSGEPESYDELGRSPQPIIGGANATTEQIHATVVLLSGNGQLKCTGALIAPTVILTAAHCLRNRDSLTGWFTDNIAPNEVSVLAGSLTTAQAEPAKQYAVQTVISHQAFPNQVVSESSGLGQNDDIGMLILDREVSDISPAPIMPFDQFDARVPPGTMLTLSGYGDDSSDPYQAQAGTLKIATSPYQRRTDYELFVGGDGLADSCPGDSGGPAYVFGEQGAEIVGINSRGHYEVEEMCGGGGMYTFASAYETWITEHAEGAYPPPPPPEPEPDPDPKPPPEDAPDEDEPEVSCTWSASSVPSRDINFVLIGLMLAATAGHYRRRRLSLTNPRAGVG